MAENKPTVLVSPQGDEVEVSSPAAITSLRYGQGYRVKEDEPEPTADQPAPAKDEPAPKAAALKPVASTAPATSKDA